MVFAVKHRSILRANQACSVSALSNVFNTRHLHVSWTSVGIWKVEMKVEKKNREDSDVDVDVDGDGDGDSDSDNDGQIDVARLRIVETGHVKQRGGFRPIATEGVG
jgi:hypothetical protein